MKKMTKKEAFTLLLNMEQVCQNEEIVAILEHEIELLERKASAPRKPTKTQTANLELAGIILELMVSDETYTTTEVVKILNEKTGEEYSTQKISRILKNLSEDGKVVKTVDKKKSYWSIAE